VLCEGPLEKRRDPEIEDFGYAIASDEDIRRLQIAMHDEMRMRVLNGVADLPEQSEPGLERQRPLTAVGRD
jgi:hypothetical protein